MNTDETRLQLVFDVGGVLAENLDGFWSGLAEAGGMERKALRRRYKEDIGSGLWRGSITEDEFWDWLSKACPEVGTEKARELLKRTLIPLPALERLALWSREADIHILSNHVAAWIMPLFTNLEGKIASFTVSSEAGFHKPDLRLFEWTAQRLNGPTVCFIDDKPDNLEASRLLGWEPILADSEGRWIEEIDCRLHIEETRK